jgi:hypothetical protein
MNLFEIKTTAYQEENFILLTDLSENEIAKSIKPIVEMERLTYTNDELVNALLQSYPNATILHFNKNAVELVII